ncbi:hypothetical protein [Hymenobacter ruricola]|uniref:Lipoprotein n=1 Tax=Hymenobacter ruricola TaxID=2791023 RepID=A0ABS0HZR9_9BACT|nr:hypothetical protein [Hymenobacter ruricola]MBF9220190.1 hypothetical protein [Hymenobacter ruricola]
MTKLFTFLLACAELLLACLGSGCRETTSPHGSTEVGLVYDYIVQHDSLVHGEFVVLVPAGFHRYSEETKFSNFAFRSERIGRSLDAALLLTVRPECLATPNTSAEWQALRTQLNASGTEANAIFLAFSAQCNGRDGRHYYYVERSGVEAGRRKGSYEGDIYVVYQGRIEREILVWIS